MRAKSAVNHISVSIQCVACATVCERDAAGPFAFLPAAVGLVALLLPLIVSSSSESIVAHLNRTIWTYAHVVQRRHSLCPLAIWVTHSVISYTSAPCNDWHTSLWRAGTSVFSIAVWTVSVCDAWIEEHPKREGFWSVFSLAMFCKVVVGCGFLQKYFFGVSLCLNAWACKCRWFVFLQLAVGMQHTTCKRGRVDLLFGWISMRIFQRLHIGSLRADVFKSHFWENVVIVCLWLHLRFGGKTNMSGHWSFNTRGTDS